MRYKMVVLILGYALAASAELGGDLYTIGGDYSPYAVPYMTEIQRLSCTSGVCSWTIINQHLKIGRFGAVAIPVTDSMCTLN